jgi:hypothetical protein
MQNRNFNHHLNQGALMRRSSILFNLLGAVGLVGLLIGCGSGGGGASTGTGGTASGSAAASGTVTGFGSVFVNGKKFETNDVEVRHDGITERCTISQATRCGLEEGMTVKVSGDFSGSSHRATTIVQEDTLEGPITNVDVLNSQFSVLGQTVLVDDMTRFDSGVNLTNLVDGNIVEVSGFVKADGIVVASFVERKAGIGCGADGCEIKGVVKNHDHATTSFQIGGLTVIYDIDGTIPDTIIGDMPIPSGSNWNGLFMEVKGTAFNSGTSTLTATKVERENQGFGNNMDEFEVEGFVTRVDGAGDFFIGTTHVLTTANTQFRGGMIDEIVVGAKLSAEGRLANGILTAKHVKFHASAKLEGNIVKIDANTFGITGLPGVLVTVNSQTEFKLDSGNTLNSLPDGSHVRVRGRVSGDSSVIATRIEQRSGDTDVDLQGPVKSMSDPILTILGVPVNTTGMRFEGLDDGVISREAFFGVVKEGTLVKVKGKLVGGVVVWEEAELED